MAIRNAAKAIIVNNGKILVNRNRNTLGDMCYGLPEGAVYYDLPGGGQNQYETLEEAVRRECLEETGYTVTVNRLAALYEEISTNERFRAEYARYAHKIHFIFVCGITGEKANPPTEKDLDMLEAEWVDIGTIQDLPLYPEAVRTNMPLILESNNMLFLGSQSV